MLNNVLRKPIVQVLVVFVMAWMVFSMLQRAGQWAVLLALSLVGLFGFTLYILLLRPEVARQLYGTHPWVRTYLDLVCRGCELPPPRDEKTREELFRLRDPADYPKAFEKLAGSVRGMDSTIQGVLSRLEENQKLERRARTIVYKRPLGVFLIAGPNGIGKRHLARCLTGAVYHDGRFLELDMREYAQAATAAPLFGDANTEGLLVNTLIGSPCVTIVASNIESASPAIMTQFRNMLADGCLTRPQGGKPIPIESCIFVMTTTCAVEELAALERSKTGPPARRLTLLRETVSRRLPMPEPLCHLLNDVFVVGFPTLRTRAEVVALLLMQGCYKYRKTLRWVDPKLLLDEALAITPECGYEPAPARAASLLREALLQADRFGSDTIDLKWQT